MREEVTIVSFLNVLVAKIEHAPINSEDQTWNGLWLEIWKLSTKIGRANILLREGLRNRSKNSKGAEKTLAIHQHIDGVMTELQRESNIFIGKRFPSEQVKILKERSIKEINNILTELEELREQTPLKEPLTLDDMLAMAG